MPTAICRAGLAAALASLALGAAGCSADSTSSDTGSSSPPATTAEKKAPSEREQAEKAWKTYINAEAKRQADALGFTVAKVEATVDDDPQDYGTGVKVAIGTAYVEMEKPGGEKTGTLFSGEIPYLGGQWVVSKKSVEQKAPEDAVTGN